MRTFQGMPAVFLLFAVLIFVILFQRGELQGLDFYQGFFWSLVGTVALVYALGLLLVLFLLRLFR